jgi:tetratricopeptide (TPR) repeat protein
MRRITFAVAALVAGAVALPAWAVDSPSPQTFTVQSAAPPAAKKPAAKAKVKAAKKQKRSDAGFLKGYQHAHGLIYQQHDYTAGITALRALKRDGHPDVANLVGFASRKLGRYDDAKHWYEKALAADPNHSRTWSYYGMWHAEQGNLLKAKDHLAKVASLCGTGCRDYVELQAVIDGTGTY